MNYFREVRCCAYLSPPLSIHEGGKHAAIHVHHQYISPFTHQHQPLLTYSLTIHQHPPPPTYPSTNYHSPVTYPSTSTNHHSPPVLVVGALHLSFHSKSKGMIIESVSPSVSGQKSSFIDLGKPDAGIKVMCSEIESHNMSCDRLLKVLSTCHTCRPRHTT